MPNISVEFCDLVSKFNLIGILCKQKDKTSLRLPTNFTLTHLSWKKCPVFELPQEESNEEAAKHEAHGEQGCVRVRWFHTVDNNSYVASSIVVDEGFFHLWVPGIFNRCVQVIVIEHQWMGLKGLKGVLKDQTLQIQILCDRIM